MNEFKIKENGFSEIKKTLILKSVPMLILVSGASLAINYFKPNAQPSDVYALLFTIPIIIGAIIFGLFRGIKRQRGLFESYKLIINENEIIREQTNTPRISIPHSEIKSIHRNPKGTLTIVGNSKTEVIGIPSQIDDYDKLDDLLAKIHPITYSDKKSFAEKFKGLIVLLTIGLMASVYISTNKFIVGLTGTILIIILGYSFYLTRRNKNIDKKTKNGMWLILLVLFSIIYTMYYKLSGKI
jgi:hypothetical protein